jgi:hypothetical protein
MTVPAREGKPDVRPVRGHRPAFDFGFWKGYSLGTAPKESRMDFGRRIRLIILKPKEEWRRIKEEPASIGGLFGSYAAVLAAVPPVFEFIGNVFIGERIPFYGSYRHGVGEALGRAALTYVFSLGTAFLFALAIDLLAPNFASKRSLANALKLAVYSMTPVWLAGILSLVPSLGILSLVAGLYGLYILFLGFETSMMDTPKEKVAPYFGISLVIVAALFLVFWVILKAIFAIRYPGI